MVESLPQLGWAVVEPVDPHVSAGELAASLRRASWATGAEPTALMRVAATPTDPRYADQWGFANTGQYGGTPGADANAEPAWDWSRGTGTVVAVVDTGVDFTNPELAGRAWVNADEIPGNSVDDDGNGRVDDVNGWDFYNSDATVFDAGDGDKHGTHVSATIGAATDNAVGGAGMAWDTAVMALKFLGPGGGSDAAGAAAIVYAVDNGADVINCSWGGGSDTSILRDAMTYAAAHNVLVAAASGNYGRDTDATPFYPASMDATNIVSVAALTRADGLASFSDWGATSVDIGAPGQTIFSAQPKLPGALLIEKSPYRIVYLAFPAESVTDSSRAQRADIALGGPRGHGDERPGARGRRRLVGCGSGEVVGERASAYTAALAGAGYTERLGVLDRGERDAFGATLQGKVVVWFTGLDHRGLRRDVHDVRQRRAGGTGHLPRRRRPDGHLQRRRGLRHGIGSAARR